MSFNSHAGRLSMMKTRENMEDKGRKKKRMVLDGCKGVNRKEQLGWGGGGGLRLTILLKMVTRKILSETERKLPDVPQTYYIYFTCPLH